MGKKTEPMEPGEILAALRAVVAEHGEKISIKRFCGLTGIPETQIYFNFDNWGDAREAAGLPRAYRPGPRISDEELLEELHRVTTELGRFPAWHEFNRRAPMNFQCLYRRFGRQEQVVARYRKWVLERELQRRAEAARARRDAADAKPVANLTAEADDGTRDDVQWMRQRWRALRVGFELKSSHFRGRRPDGCDLLVVGEHDWKACPVTVLVLGEILGTPAPLHRGEKQLRQR